MTQNTTALQALAQEGIQMSEEQLLQAVKQLQCRAASFDAGATVRAAGEKRPVAPDVQGLLRRVRQARM